MDDALDVIDSGYAFHEAGHCVVAAALGVPVKSATLDGVTLIVDDGCPRSERKAAIAALAGPTAEIRHCGHSVESQAQLWADEWSGDLDNAMRDLGRAAIAPALEQARQLVTEHWCSIRVVAQALLEAGSLTGDDIRALIGSRKQG